jgi:hypothetical protein
MWNAAEVDFGFTTEEIESGHLVRSANSKLSSEDSSLQEKAQYGRMLPAAMDHIFRRLLHLRKNDVFVDIGHGIGNTLLQAAHTVGCEARGIEVVQSRNFLAQTFCENLEGQRLIHRERDGHHAKIGKVQFRHGKLEQPIHRKFLSECNGSSSIKALANNFNGVFSDRSAKAKQKYYLDHFISGMFAEMKPGSILVTLHPLLDLPPPLSTVSETRERHKMATTRDASFYELEQCNIGKANLTVSWSHNGGNTDDVIVYRYTRLEQVSKTAVFLCSNPHCRKAIECIPIPAAKMISIQVDHQTEERIVINHCDCNVSAKVFRRRERVGYM